MSQTSQLVAELQATRSPEAAVRRALERVGEQISGILQRAHDTAEQITTSRAAEAEDRLSRRARRRRDHRRADERVKDLDAETDRIWAERLADHRGRPRSRAQLPALAEDAAQRFPPAPGETSETAVQAKPVFDAESVEIGEPEPAGGAVPATANGEAEELPDLQTAPDPDATAVMPPQQPADNGTNGE